MHRLGSRCYATWKLQQLVMPRASGISFRAPRQRFSISLLGSAVSRSAGPCNCLPASGDEGHSDDERDAACDRYYDGSGNDYCSDDDYGSGNDYCSDDEDSLEVGNTGSMDEDDSSTPSSHVQAADCTWSSTRRAAVDLWTPAGSASLRGALAQLVSMLTSSTPSAREAAVGALRCLAFDDEHREAIVEAGAVAPLVGLLAAKSGRVKAQAAGALFRLATKDTRDFYRVTIACKNVDAIVAAGAAAPLVRLLGSKSTAVQQQAAGALMALAGEWLSGNQREIREKIGAAGAAAPLLNLLGSSSDKVQEYASKALRHLAEEEANRAAIIAPLFGLLGSSSESVQHRAALTLEELSYECRCEIAGAVAAGTLVPLLSLLGCSSASLQERAACALWDSGLAYSCGDEIVATGVLVPLVNLLGSGSTILREAAAGVLLAMVSRGHGGKIVAAGAVAPLVSLLDSSSGDLQVKVAETLAHLAVDDDTRVKIAAAGAVAPLVRLLRSGSATAETYLPGTVQEFAAAALQKLAEEGETRAQIAAAGAVALLVSLLGQSDFAGPQIDLDLLLILSRDGAIGRQIVDAGAIAPLVSIISKWRRGSVSVKFWERTSPREDKAVELLASLALDDYSRAKIVAAGAVNHLVSMLASRSEGGRRRVAEALAVLAATRENRAKIVEAGAVKPLLNMLADGSGKPPTRGERAAAQALLRLGGKDA